MLACIAVAAALVGWRFLSSRRPDAKAVAAAQDEVYETVARDFVTRTDGHSGTGRLVFDKSVLTGVIPAAESGQACKDSIRKVLQREREKPPFDTLADKAYRLIVDGYVEHLLRADTIRDFTEKACIGGRLSETFHTDLPRTFISPGNVNFGEVWPKRQSETFAQRFPGANGIISFSHVGFDSGLDQALVSTSFVCGYLCAEGTVYILQKRRGHWKVVSKVLVWIS